MSQDKSQKTRKKITKVELHTKVHVLINLYQVIRYDFLDSMHTLKHFCWEFLMRNYKIC